MDNTPHDNTRTHSACIYLKNARTTIPPPEESCCLIGHRPKYYHFGTNEQHPDCIALKSRVREKCEYLITEKGVSHFISGGALGLDTWAMEEILSLKKKHCHVTLECALPYASMVGRFAPSDQERYTFIAVLGWHYARGCMQQRNEYMVNHLHYVIAVWTGEKSGTANTVYYAEKCGREVHRLTPNS